MNFDYAKLLESLNDRKFGTSDYQKILFEDAKFRSSFESYDKNIRNDFSKSKQYLDLKESDTVKYVIGAMLPVAQNYTQQIVSDRNRVQNVLEQLNQNIYKGSELTFRPQGSVPNNTHIKRNSDVDLLTILTHFWTLQPGIPNNSPFQGEPVDELLVLRNNCINQIAKMMPDVNIDDSGSKSVKLSKGSLVVKVDVVPANWYDTVNYQDTQNEVYRGVMVLDKYKKERTINFPFMFNYHLTQKDGGTAGVFKQAIRLLKNIKVDAEKTLDRDIKFSSYGITSLLYDLDNHDYYIGFSPLTLVDVILKQITRYTEQNKFNTLTDPLGEKLNPSSNTIEGLRILQGAVQSLKSEIEKEVDLGKEIKIA